MPNFDTGHYFLTLLSPIKQGTTDGGVSYAQNLRMLLAALRTAQQSPATSELDEKAGDKNLFVISSSEESQVSGDAAQRAKNNSPFALSKRTHICRFMVLDDTIYNGRNQRNALLTKLKMKLQKVKFLNPLLQPQPVDRLSCAYLMFTAEIDASLKPGEPLPQTLTPEQQDEVRDTYARELWETMPAEIHEIYSNCEGFAPKSAEDCADYMKRCQVETTMPFNDYWLPGEADLKSLPSNILRPLVLVPLAITLLALLGWIFRVDWFPLGWLFGWTAGWTLLGGLAATAAALYGAYRYIIYNGNKPMPAGEYADLPSVLKSLYLQQNFADFAIDMQGESDEKLYEQFGQFIADHQPENKMSPSQAPGVIASRPIARKEG